jgi:hypothetical protein
MLDKILKYKNIILSIKNKISEEKIKEKGWIMNNKYIFGFFFVFLLNSVILSSLKEVFFKYSDGVFVFLLLLPILLPIFTCFLNDFKQRRKNNKTVNSYKYFLFKEIDYPGVPFSPTDTKIHRNITKRLTEEEKIFLNNTENQSLFNEINNMEELIFQKIRSEKITKSKKEEIIQFIKDFDLNIDEEKFSLLMNNQQEEIKINKTIIKNI